MPCEACNIQFTVFKRKKSCTECRRLYCSNCLTKNKERILCKRCVIFTTRPISKIELLKLKAKDLIFYLQSKHISTTGCVEKEELVNLVLIHVDNLNNFSPDSQSSTAFSMGNDPNDDTRSNPFDQFRSTCQNLFTTFTEKIAADLNFDLKPNQGERQPNVCENQPRYSNNLRNPSFSSNSSATTNNSNRNNQRPTTITSNANQSTHRFDSPKAEAQASFEYVTPSTLNSPTQSAEASTCGNSSSSSSEPSVSQATQQRPLNTNQSNQMHSNQPSSSTQPKLKPKCAQLAEFSRLHNSDCCSDTGSGCECSDDELITKFQEKYREKSADSIAVDKVTDDLNSAIKLDKDRSSGSTSSSTKTGNSSDSTSPKDDASAIESSDVSSFEDLGAVGGMAANPSTSDISDKWQIVSNPWKNVDDTASTSSIVTDEKVETANNSETTNLPNSITEQPQHSMASDNQREQQDKHEQTSDKDSEAFRLHSTCHRPDLKAKLEKTFKSRHSIRKITRRQSDGIVYTATTSDGTRQIHRRNLVEDLDTDDADADEDNNLGNSSNSEDTSRKRLKKSCHKCGKTKGDLKKYISRFRRQLETTTNCSETEIRQQLDAFLEFLENRSRNSFDSKDEDTIVQSGDSDGGMVRSPTQLIAEAIALDEIEIEDYDDDYDEEAGIHVYGSNEETTSSHVPREFFNICTIEKKEDLESLSVKQLKEVLMLNRVDFKGCCEKSELLERVSRLWDDLQNCPAVDKLSSVDLCKICMDAAIECVLLECGHMATCTSCGKVLSECPICRQYIVRVVRFFKA